MYSRYFLQHLLWLRDGFRDFYEQPPQVHHWDIADVALKCLKNRDDALLWLEACLAYEDFYTVINLRSFLYDHSIHYVAVFRYDNRRVLFEQKDSKPHGKIAI